MRDKKGANEEFVAPHLTSRITEFYEMSRGKCGKKPNSND
jgi:hypothetical protein